MILTWLRMLRDWLYNKLGLYAPEVCVYCGAQTSTALPYDVNIHGWPCCANCEPSKGLHGCAICRIATACNPLDALLEVMMTMLNINECTDEVITQVANTLKQWSAMIVNGAADDSAATPLTPETRAYAEFVSRMRANTKMARELEKGDAPEPETNAANGIFWFIQGWRAADAAMESKLPKI